MPVKESFEEKAINWIDDAVNACWKLDKKNPEQERDYLVSRLYKMKVFPVLAKILFGCLWMYEDLKKASTLANNLYLLLRKINVAEKENGQEEIILHLKDANEVFFNMYEPVITGLTKGDVKKALLPLTTEELKVFFDLAVLFLSLACEYEEGGGSGKIVLALLRRGSFLEGEIEE